MSEMKQILDRNLEKQIMTYADARAKLVELFPEIEFEDEPLPNSSGGKRIFLGIFRGRKVVVKLHRENGKADQEAKATRKAKIMLSEKALPVPCVKYVRDNAIVLEYISGDKFEISDMKHRRLSIEYLIEMHSVRASDDLEDHYFGQALRNRIHQERLRLEQALQAAEQLDEVVSDFDCLCLRAVSAADSDSKGVISHGDYQPRNLLCTGYAVVPIDWVDFGRAHQAYDICNLLYELPFKTVLEGTIYYANRKFGKDVSSSQIESILREGSAIAGVIRAGSHFRQIINGSDRCFVEGALRTVRHGLELTEARH